MAGKSGGKGRGRPVGSKFGGKKTSTKSASLPGKGLLTGGNSKPGEMPKSMPGMKPGSKSMPGTKSGKKSMPMSPAPMTCC